VHYCEPPHDFITSLNFLFFFFFLTFKSLCNKRVSTYLISSVWYVKITKQAYATSFEMLSSNQSSYSLNHANLIQCHVFSNCVCEKLWLICWQCPYFVDMLFEFDLYHYDGNHNIFFFFL